MTVPRFCRDLTMPTEDGGMIRTNGLVELSSQILLSNPVVFMFFSYVVSFWSPTE